MIQLHRDRRLWPALLLGGLAGLRAQQDVSIQNRFDELTVRQFHEAPDFETKPVSKTLLPASWTFSGSYALGPSYNSNVKAASDPVGGWLTNGLVIFGGTLESLNKKGRPQMFGVNFTLKAAAYEGPHKAKDNFVHILSFSYSLTLGNSIWSLAASDSHVILDGTSVSNTPATEFSLKYPLEKDSPWTASANVSTDWLDSLTPLKAPRSNADASRPGFKLGLSCNLRKFKDANSEMSQWAPTLAATYSRAWTLARGADEDSVADTVGLAMTALELKRLHATLGANCKYERRHGSNVFSGKPLGLHRDKQNTSAGFDASWNAPKLQRWKFKLSWLLTNVDSNINDYRYHARIYTLSADRRL